MHDMMIATTGFFGAACFAAFSWGIKGHFRSTGTMPAGMRLTSALSFSGFLWFLWHLAQGVAASWPAAVALFAGSLCVFFWAIQTTRRTPPTLAFDTDQPSFLLHQGPYRFVRHPFYLAYLMFWVGTAAAAHGLLAWFAPALMAMLYFHAATREEQKFAMSELASAYAAYRAKAGMFLPRPSSLLAG
jgi:protein-S-isoprenylcysteine O-methyltransferase Ste14